MIAEFHFLRPCWFLLLFPLIGLVLLFWRRMPQLQAWSAVCDSHLLEHLLQSKAEGRRKSFPLFLFLSALFMILSMAGPAWYKLPVTTYKPIQPRVLVLDMSSNMLATDLTPNRLSRAKFKLHDVLTRKDLGQFGLVVFTAEPFVVSPLTDDGQTIASLLPTLTPDIMPVGGHKLEKALQEAAQLIQQAGYKQGQILVLTGEAPSEQAIETAKQLAQSGVYSSIMPVTAENKLSPLFQYFAQAAEGQLVHYSADSSDLEQWIKASQQNKYLALRTEDATPLWRDEGRWFLIPALLCLLVVFRRGWLQRVAL